MNQFESPSAAALQQIKNEIGSPASPVIKLAGKLTELNAALADIIGVKGASAGESLFKKLLDVAPSKDEANLLYFAEWVVYDINNLYRRLDEAEVRRIQNAAQTQKAAELIANATLHVPRTNTETRLQRLAHIFVNGLKDDDLDVESTDDMMRAASELKDEDISLLRKLYDSQASLVARLLSNSGQDPTNWFGEVQRIWKDFVDHGGLNPQEHLSYRSSFSRLESQGLIQFVNSAGTYGVGRDIYALLAEGKKFCERIQEIAAQ